MSSNITIRTKAISNYLIEYSVFRKELDNIDFYYKANKEINNDFINEINENMLLDGVGNQGNSDLLFIENVLRRKMLYSVITNLYTLLEQTLNSICSALIAKRRYQLKLSDLKGEGLVRAKTYLTKICNYDLSTNDDRFLSEFNQIRNCIVHTNGDIDKSRNKENIIRIINKSKDFELIDNSFLSVSEEYIYKVINIIRKQSDLLHIFILEK